LNASKGNGLSVFRDTGFVNDSGGGPLFYGFDWCFLGVIWSLSAFGGCKFVMS
jgi:hypothetical protein